MQRVGGWGGGKKKQGTWLKLHPARINGSGSTNILGEAVGKEEREREVKVVPRLVGFQEDETPK